MSFAYGVVSQPSIPVNYLSNRETWNSPPKIILSCLLNIQDKLSLYKVPRKIIFDQVPRNPTGKLMKPQLREKFTGRKEAFKKLD